jgi:hypothetical protein
MNLGESSPKPQIAFMNRAVGSNNQTKKTGQSKNENMDEPTTNASVEQTTQVSHLNIHQHFMSSKFRSKHGMTKTMDDHYGRPESIKHQ